MILSRKAERAGMAALFRLALIALLLFVGTIGPSLAQEKATILATTEQGFGRLVLSFPDRMDLPDYQIKFDNGVLAIEFKQPVTMLVPDIAVALPDYVTIARLDPDGKGLRLGLRTTFNINHMEAGEKLFVDLLPTTWQGLPPSLPADVVADLAVKAKKAAELAEQQRKAEEANTVHPVAKLSIGRNPTFFRLQFDWSVDTQGRFALDQQIGTIHFDWPVAIDIADLKVDLPDEIVSADSNFSPLGSNVVLKVGKNVVPRFYAVNKREFVVDIDIPVEEGGKAALAADDLRRKTEADIAAAKQVADAQQPVGEHVAGPDAANATVTPTVTTVAGTVRINFPFVVDTAAAVFQRGNTLWMLFDTPSVIAPPEASDALKSVASALTIIPAGDTRIVRLDLSTQRLATLGSEGRSWVLSLGDVLLNPTEPIPLDRHRDQDGQYEMSADLVQPDKIHDFHDPDVGDTLQVVTVFPPARGVVHNQQFVDFDALKSVHGLVVRATNPAVKVALDKTKATISVDGGLTLSPIEKGRTLDGGLAPSARGSYVDFGSLIEDNDGKLVERRESLVTKAAEADGRVKELARLDLADFYLANDFSYEAIGVLDVLQKELKSNDLGKKVKLTRAVADTLAGRSQDALTTLNTDAFDEEVDALLWRAIARTQSGDFKGARLDAITAEPVVDDYPMWMRLDFLFAGIRAAVETNDDALAQRLIKRIEFKTLDPDQITQYQLLEGRIAELENQPDDAIQLYGQVVTADVRPTRAEAVYRTLLLLRQKGTIDVGKATQTLAAEALLWRGNTLEADMDKLLAELYFQNRNYREGFEAVKQAVAYFPDTPSSNALLGQAQGEFEKLFLDGAADTLPDVQALSLYYDFRELTPPGARGDEMIRNLARRLVKVDLLTQAADLLEYQISSRLKGAAQAQVAADLAAIRIADRDPEGALRAINTSQAADLSPALDRQRRILEARALIDSGREDLAIDLVSKLDGRDADLLRVDGYWTSKNYGQAAALLEMVYDPGPDAGPLNAEARMNLVKAGVGFVLANDQLGLSRLRSKFSDEMANSEEWPMFEYVTRSVAPDSTQFKQVAREVAATDSLDAFLKAYRDRYGDDETPAQAAPASAG